MKSDNLKLQLQQISKKVLTARIPLFLLLVASVYVFVAWRISILQNAQPSANSVSAQVQSMPHIDPTTISKIQSLQNNSVSVKALFDQARQNPFQE